MIWCLLLSFKPHPLFWSLKLKIFIFHLYNPSLKQMTLSYILAPDSYYNSSLISWPKKFKILKDSRLSQSDCRLILPWYLGNLFIHYYLQYPLLFLYIYWVVVILYNIYLIYYICWLHSTFNQGEKISSFHFTITLKWLSQNHYIVWNRMSVILVADNIQNGGEVIISWCTITDIR